ncbi:hypothetical protein FQN57_004767 [Myotisia sp. PD_48]|nr:hypothetical protein FQN57_004767 [Myotisia sp. PD_48]
MEAHAVSKSDISVNRTLALDAKPESIPPIGPSSVRVQPVLISLTSNNLTYARLGDALHWWDAYPAGKIIPQPLNDTETWQQSGIVPAWGYAVVLESSTSIPQGTILWGYFPTSSGKVDLKLELRDVKRQWVETSEHRTKLMPIYNLYKEVDLPVVPSSDPPSFSEGQLTTMAFNALFKPVWEAGYLLNKHVFPQEPGVLTPMHPFGLNLEWTLADADLSSAVMIGFSASGKTARSFAYNLSKRPPPAGPLGLLQVTSSPKSIAEVEKHLNPAYATKVISYTDVFESLDWIESLKPSKIILLDFGSRENTTKKFYDVINAHPRFSSIKVIVIKIGSEQKAALVENLTDETFLAMASNTVMFNTSAVQELAKETQGAQSYYDQLEAAWNEYLADRAMILPDIEIIWGEGVSGQNGIEAGWKRLCQGQVATHEDSTFIIVANNKAVSASKSQTK